MEEVLISVIIRAHNRREFLLGAVKSALNQTLDRKFYEVIVIKNWRDDEVDNFLEKNNVINLFKEDIAGQLILEGAKASSGNVLSFLDDDDRFLENKLEAVYNNFKKRRRLTYYHNGYSAVDDSGKPVSFLHNTIDFGMSNISIIKKALRTDILARISFFQDPIVFSMALDYGEKIVNDKTKLTEYLVHQSTSNFLGINFAEYKERSYASYKKYLDNANIAVSLLKRRRAKNYMKAMIGDLKMGRFQFNPEIKPDHVLNFIACRHIPMKRRWIQFKSYMALKLFPDKFRPIILKKREEQFKAGKEN